MKLIVNRRGENVVPPLADGPPLGEQDVWDWLQKVSQEFETLREVNTKLTARVKELERMREGASSMTYDELLAELPTRMARSLESAQEVANEIVRRARNREKEILQAAEETAAVVARQSELEASETLKRAAAEAKASVDEARSQGEQIIAKARSDAERLVAEARSRRERVLSALEEERAELIQELRTLQSGRSRLLEALAEVRTTLESDLPVGNGQGHASHEPGKPQRKSTWVT
ncbi:MAG: hypothetical protein M3198_15470 [Actinomycetota bacterium]|nr:hypothetical protein [Actinomycetota bacterium]